MSMSFYLQINFESLFILWVDTFAVQFFSCRWQLFSVLSRWRPNKTRRSLTSKKCDSLANLSPIYRSDLSETTSIWRHFIITEHVQYVWSSQQHVSNTYIVRRFTSTRFHSIIDLFCLVDIWKNMLAFSLQIFMSWRRLCVLWHK